MFRDRHHFVSVGRTPPLVGGVNYKEDVAISQATLELETDLAVPEAVRLNGTLYIHAYLTRSGDSPDPDAGGGDRARYSGRHTVHRVRKMNKFKKRSYARTHNLLTGQTAASEEDVLVRVPTSSYFFLFLYQNWLDRSLIPTPRRWALAGRSVPRSWPPRKRMFWFESPHPPLLFC